jgi:MFS transporter, FHS family, Na+ dependent glucose transporter 1
MQNNHSKFILYVACAIFLVFGIITAGLGPILPELATQTGSTISAVGGVFTAIFLGALISQLISGFLVDHFGYKKVLFISMFILATGTIGFSISRSIWWMLAITFVAGLGHGAVDLTTNVMVSNAFPHKNASYMNLLHFFFGAGAFIGPACISLTLTNWNNGIMVLWIAAATIAILAFFVLLLKPVQTTHSSEPNQPSGTHVYRSLSLWMFGGLLLLYVGVENGIGGWATTYMNVTTGMVIKSAALVSSGFWGALTVGRLVMVAVSRKFSPRQILLGTFLASCLFGLAFALLSGTYWPSIISIVLIGFFSGAVYPTVMSLVTTTFKRDTGKAASVVAAMGSIGGMLIPLGQGYLLENVSPSASAWFATFGLFLMLALFGLIIRSERREKTAQQPTQIS